MSIIDSPDFVTFQDGTTERIEYEKWYLGMDWGSTDPASLSLYGLTHTTENFPKPRLIQVRQTYRVGELTSFWKRRALAYQRWVRRYYDGYIQKMLCDKSRPEHIEEFRIGGLPAVKTDGGAGSVRENINAVKVRLDENTLFFVRDNLDNRDEILEAAYDPLCTVDEITRYENPKTNPLMKKVPDPIGANHGLDELGYVARDIHIPQSNNAQIDTFTGEDVLNTKLQLPGAKPTPARWKRHMGVEY